MDDLHAHILSVLADERTRVLSAVHVLDELDLRGVSPEMSEFDAALADLEDAGRIRIQNKSAPRNEWQLTLRSAPKQSEPLP